MERGLLEFFLSRGSYPDATQEIEHLETHISHLFLTGPYAYKVKKRVNLGFLDFSTLERRRYFCEREVQLNRRFAPDLYEGVVTISRTAGGFAFGDNGPVEEYSVKMKQFDSKSLFTDLLERGELTEKLLASLVDSIASFHRSAERKPGLWGPEQIARVFDESIVALREKGCPPLSTQEIQEISSSVDRTLRQHRGVIEERQKFAVRVLHGDLHLKNICLFQGRPLLFDGIEFNDEFLIGDVWADFAFLLMDLRYRGRPDLLHAALNAYLEATDDYGGLPLLRLYEGYRALVRAKVSAFERETIDDPQRRAHATESIRRHMDLARAELAGEAPHLVAIGGLSGSGKTTLAREFVRRLGGVLIRSDVVRKRLLGIPPLHTAPPEGYAREMSVKVYAGMAERAKSAFSYGGFILLDAVHGEPAQRRAVEALAKAFSVPFTGIWCSVPRDEAIRRLSNRVGDASDADATVLDHQYSTVSEGTEWLQIRTDDSFADIFARIASHLHSTISAAAHF